MQIKQITTDIETFLEIRKICEESKDNALTIDSVSIPDKDEFMSVFIQVLDPSAYIERLYPLLYDSKSLEVENETIS